MSVILWMLLGCQVELLTPQGEELAEASLYVVVEAVNNEPSVVTPSYSIVIAEDAEPTNIPGVYITDPDVHETTKSMVKVCYLSEHFKECQQGTVISTRYIARSNISVSRHDVPGTVETCTMYGFMPVTNAGVLFLIHRYYLPLNRLKREN